MHPAAMPHMLMRIHGKRQISRLSRLTEFASVEMRSDTTYMPRWPEKPVAVGMVLGMHCGPGGDPFSRDHQIGGKPMLYRTKSFDRGAGDERLVACGEFEVR